MGGTCRCDTDTYEQAKWPLAMAHVEYTERAASNSVGPPRSDVNTYEDHERTNPPYEAALCGQWSVEPLKGTRVHRSLGIRARHLH